MSVLLAKSIENMRVADLLIQQHHCYTASVHCSYYSVFQRSVHVLMNKYSLTQQDIDLQAAFNSTGKDSHKKTIAVLYEKIEQTSGRLKAIDFRRDMDKLKSKRVKADYSDEVIDQSFSLAAYNQAHTLQQLLNNAFSLT